MPRPATKTIPAAQNPAAAGRRESRRAAATRRHMAAMAGIVAVADLARAMAARAERETKKT